MDYTGWITLSLADHIGGKTLHALFDHFAGDTDAIFCADAASLQRVPGIGPKIAQNILSLKRDVLTNAITQWQADGVMIIPALDAAFPQRLHTIKDAPATLFVRGEWQADDSRRHVAIVGTRQPTADAAQTARKLATMLAEQGCVIISGLARGIDREAHHGALVTAEGRTLAVLGCGVLNIYPADNHDLVEAISKRGALMSECAPDAPPSGPRLVARNRIISGLSDAVIVVETGRDGGAMYAARRAWEQGRKVYTVDYPASGNQELIANGAYPLHPHQPELDLT